ncbi:MAG: lysophospholipid acyltransferase family protein [Clostridiaceae bacterium]|nr:lysophospholipid acyltransferase family protein [Clostridiaceae bacterium]
MNNNTSPLPAEKKASRSPADHQYDKYPLRRGLIGNLAYTFGVAYTRLGIKLSAKGLENIPRSIPYVIAANHETYVDGMWIGSYLPRRHFRKFCCIAAKDLEDSHGLLGKLIVRVGRAIAVDRFGNPVRGLIIARRKVDEGNILLVHPEGTRSVDGHLGSFKDGAAYISIKSKVPLLPVFIDGGYEVFSRHMKKPQTRDPATGRKREIILTFGKPLNPADYASARDMTAALTAWMEERFQEKIIPRTFQ